MSKLQLFLFALVVSFGVHCMSLRSLPKKSRL